MHHLQDFKTEDGKTVSIVAEDMGRQMKTESIL